MHKYLFLFIILISACPAVAAEWKPEKNVELIVSTAAGGNQDSSARAMQRIWQERRLVPQSIVMNKPGGGGNIAYAYLTQRARDAHYVMMLAPTMFTNRITGAGSAHYTDFTPLALLYNENVFISVKADSPIKTGRDIIERLRKDPSALSVAVASVLGNHIHMGFAIPMKVAGVDVKKLKVVAFKSSADSLTALAGGHVDIAASTFGTILPHLAAGRVRVIAVSAAQRLPGALAAVPTWKEQGTDTAFASWRGMVGARGMSEVQIAYWDQVLAAATATDDWRREVEKNYWAVNYLPSRDVHKYWDNQYRELEDILTELGLAKKTN
jgi:putative tricarboxylic transport membrane protein